MDNNDAQHDNSLAGSGVQGVNDVENNLQHSVGAEEPAITSESPLPSNKRAKNSIRSTLLLITGIVVIFTIALPSYFYGPTLYKKITDDPNVAFENMLRELLSIKTEFNSVESSGDYGVFSAKYDRDSTDFFAPVTRGKSSLDLITGDFSVSTDVNIVGTKQGQIAMNLEKLSIKKSGISLNQDKLSLVSNKWVGVPGDLDFSKEGLVVGFFEVSADFNNPYRFLPTGYLDEPFRTEAHLKLLEFAPYSYSCERTKVDNITLCDVTLDSLKLDEYYRYLNKQAGFGFQNGQWPNSFKVFINDLTNLPTEVQFANEENSITKLVTAYNIDITDISAPAGPISIDEYRKFAVEFESSL